MGRSYPDRNPFPHQGTDSIEGTVGMVGISLPDSPLPTLPLDPVKRLQILTRLYLDSFDPNQNTTGQMVVLHGDHGSGKTHSIRYIIDLMRSGVLRSSGDISPVFQAYAKAEGSDFLDIYQHLTSNMSAELLREISLRYLSVLAGEQFGIQLDNPEVSERAVEWLSAQPQRVYEYFDTYLVEEGAVQDRQVREVQRVTEGRWDFQRALYYLLSDHPDMVSLAHRWIQARNISEVESRKLGVSGPIVSADMAKWGLHLITALFGRVGRPLIIYIDQYEKLVLDLDSTRSTQNAGLLHSLVEVIPREKGMLVLSGNDEAWNALKRDLRQRFAYNVVHFPVIKLGEAQDLVRLYLDAGTMHAIQEWELETGRKTRILRGHASTVRSVDTSPDGKFVASASKDTTIKLWNLDNGQITNTLQEHKAGVNTAVFTPDGKQIVSASDDKTLMIWDADKGLLLHTLHGHQNWVNCVAISLDGRYAFSGATDMTIRQWDLQTGSQIQQWKAHDDTVWSLSFTPDGERMLSTSSDGSLCLWDWHEGKRLRTLRGHTSWVNAAVIHPDGRRAWSVSDDLTLIEWDIENGKLLRTLKGHQTAVRAVDITPDGSRVISASIDGQINVWDAENGTLLRTIQVNSSGTCAVAVATSGKSLFNGGLHLFTDSEEENDPSSGHVTTEEDMFPFTKAAVRETLRYGGGNIRRLLQICWQAFNHAQQDHLIISRELVEKTVSSIPALRLDRQGVLVEIESILHEHSLLFQRDFALGSIITDLAVLGSQKRPRLFIQISQALFKDDEAANALKSLNLAETVSREGYFAQVLLVVLGYVSPSVVQTVRQFVDDFIVYNPDTFHQNLTKILNRLPEQRGLIQGEVISGDIYISKQANLAAADKPDGNQWNELRQRLESLVASGKEEVSSLQTQLVQYFQRQQIERDNNKREEARQVWAIERRGVEEKIRENRNNRRQRELEEIERMRIKSESDRRPQVFAWTFFMLFPIAFISYLITTFFYIIGMQGFLVWLLLTAAGVGFALIYRLNLFAPTIIRELFAPVDSIEELNHLADAFGKQNRRPWDWLRGAYYRRTRSIRSLIAHPNPQFRYAAARLADPIEDHMLMVEFIQTERAKLVRRAFAQRLAECSDPEMINQAIKTLEDFVPEVAYIVEGAALSNKLDTNLELRSALRTLAVIAGASVDTEEGDLAGSFATAIQRRSVETPDNWIQESNEKLKGTNVSDEMNTLAAAYQVGLDQFTFEEFPKIPETSVRDAFRTLSPFEKGGLGVIDDLRSINQIDKYYFFFRQLLFLMERNLLVGNVLSLSQS